MLKSHESIFLNLQKAMDALVALLSWLIVYYTRFYLLADQVGLGDQFLKAGLMILVLSVYFFRREGLYKSHRLSSRQDELLKVAKANLLAVVSFVVVLYFVGNERLSRSGIVGYYVLSTFLFILLRVSTRNILRNLRAKGYNLRHVVLVGNSAALVQYVESIRSFRESGIVFSGWVDSKGLAVEYNIKETSLASLAPDAEEKPDSIVIGYQGEESVNLSRILSEIYNDVVPIVVLPDMSFSFVGYHVDHLAGVPALVVNQPNFSTVDVAAKRAFDIISSGLGLIIISPLLGLIAIGVKLSSPGPVFFGQERIGLDGKKFKMWKFRSMKTGAHVGQSGVPGWTQKDDPRKTKFGSFIRATSLDELPQLWNVFYGDMSLVGPRPEQPYYVEKFRSEIPAYMLRHKMKAGITGWAQVNGWRGDTSLHKRIECDLYYIRHWSIWFDIKIIFLTFWKGFINRNAY